MTNNRVADVVAYAIDQPEDTTVNEITMGPAKLHDLILAKVVARKWNNVYANAVDSGWVPTKWAEQVLRII